MTPSDRSEFEEGLLRIRSLPRFWWNSYQGCLDAGFDKSQAFQLTIATAMAQSARQVVPPSPFDGPKSDNPDDDH